MKYILILSLIIISCSKEQTEQNNYLPKGVDTLPSFVVKVPVRLYLDSSVNDYWHGVVKEAVDNWQGLGILDFSIVAEQSKATTVVGMYSENAMSGAWAYSPSNENIPGSKIAINKNTALNRIYALKTIVHEIGHVIGYKHIYSHLSVMNPNALPYSGFSSFDFSLIKTYYK